MNYFLIWLWCVTKSEFYMTTSDDQLSGWTRSSKPLLKAKLAPKKSWSMFDDLPPIWFTAAFWILLKLLHLRIMLSKSMRCTKTSNILQPATVNRKGSILLHDNLQLYVAQPTLQKLNKLAYEVLPYLPYSPDLLPTNYHFFNCLDNFFQRKCFHNGQEAENPFQEFLKSQSMDFYTTRINKHFLWAKMCWL